MTSGVDGATISTAVSLSQKVCACTHQCTSHPSHTTPSVGQAISNRGHICVVGIASLEHRERVLRRTFCDYLWVQKDPCPGQTNKIVDAQLLVFDYDCRSNYFRDISTGATADLSLSLPWQDDKHAMVSNRVRTRQYTVRRVILVVA